MTDDPFASPDSDKTIILPSPGRRNTPTQPSTGYSQSDFFGDNSTIDLDQISSIPGLNPLITAANPLLNLTVLLRSTLYRKDLMELHDYLVKNIKVFEDRSRAARIPSEKINDTRYALCTFIDESISSTPWGSDEWGKYSLLIMFHNEAVGGEKFFQLLKKFAENPQANLDILEFMYVCLSLGFEGRYRVLNDGKNQLEVLKERLVKIISTERNIFERELSPHWRTTAVKHAKSFLFMPLWILTSLCALTLLVAYLSFSFLLNEASDPVFSQMQLIRTNNTIQYQLPVQHQLPVSQPSVESPSVDSSPVDFYLTKFLNHEINEGLLTVRYENNRHIITLLGDGAFSPGSMVISQKFIPVLKRIADALNQRSGQIHVLGYTDNIPIRTLKFPSNWHLSQERANSALQLLVKMGINSSRIHSEGRADAEPIAPNNTPEGRARNRRVEIIVD